MDPTACLRSIEDAYTNREERAACEDLQHWLVVGGFEPDWSKRPKGTAVFIRWRKRHGITRPAIKPQGKRS